MMHPLHTQKWIDQLVAQGMPRYEITTRCTGRTTAQALEALAWAIEHPGQFLRVVDHHGTPNASRELHYMAYEMSRKLGLKHLHFHRGDHTIIFENRERPE